MTWLHWQLYLGMPESLTQNTSNKQHGILLAFDFGLRQTGLAVGQTLTKNVRPLAVIKANDGKPDWPLVEKYLEEFKPIYLIVGLPLNMDGSDSAMTQRARKFANRLHGRFGLEVVLQDERLSSKEAKQDLRDQVAHHQRNEKRNKKMTALDSVDAQAAAIILQSHFNAQ